MAWLMRLAGLLALLLLADAQADDLSPADQKAPLLPEGEEQQQATSLEEEEKDEEELEEGMLPYIVVGLGLASIGYQRLRQRCCPTSGAREANDEFSQPFLADDSVMAGDAIAVDANSADRSETTAYLQMLA
eukprot:TRINITY_DN11808_c0_g1_i1.p1 TRINITY_DN11808_c0_g1~~TRINITY_DN11808_c0_g1_i1.p1  ORF type:complete len:132 (-),score=50.13 TRINITY_DN11808_c0_g1_i1:385-780(-)